MLWDDRSYCRDCVQSASPTLLSFAATRRRLEEVAPYQGGKVLRRFGVMYVVIGLLFAVPFGIYGVRQEGLSGVSYSLVGLFCAGVAALIQAPAYLWMMKMQMPTVVAENGTLKVFRGPKKRLTSEAPTQAIRWRLGEAGKDRGLHGLPMSDKVLLLEWPVGKSLGFTRYERVACGWSQETRDVWEAFLTLTRFGR